jgi:hypothetical protein
MPENIKFEDLKGIIVAFLKSDIGTETCNITFAKKDEGLGRDVWRVNVTYKSSPDDLMERTSLFKIDVLTGEIVQFDKSKYWTK